jgi:hypothetical protein
VAEHLGLPDSPVLHLAVKKLADEVMPIGAGSRLEGRLIRITALRTASGAVREYLPMACATYTFRKDVELLADPAESEEAFRTVRRNWMREARLQIEAEGLDPGPDAERMATAYGWNPLPPPVSPNTTTTGLAPRTLADERGRIWRLPSDNDALFDLQNEFGRRHGRLSKAVADAFRRHGRMDTLRMLVMRGAEGECINLAARAFAYGPMPPIKRPLPKAWPGRPTPEEQLKRLEEVQAGRDEQHLEALLVEAGELRRRGYVD